MIIFVRHGERADNSSLERHLIVNKHDPHLTKVGQTQAKEAGQKVKILQNGLKTTIYCSPFQRCIQTAEQIAKEIDSNRITIKSQICETLYQTLYDSDPLDNLEYNKKNIELEGIEIQDEQFSNDYYPETMESVNKRIIEFTQELALNLKQDECAIVVTHQRPLKSILGFFGAVEPEVGYCHLLALQQNNASKLCDFNLL
ncbi:hypothetical protein pb186bvf_015103 [Paramecium bursaria]